MPTLHHSSTLTLASICLLLIASGCSEQAPETFTNPPAWASEVVWYQIMMERFNNGDPSNDPTIADIQDGYPGFAPASWAVTPWTQQFYKPDPYFAAVYGKQDKLGVPLNAFMQVARLRRYGGDLQGVIDKIDYLDSLGITAIYFNPLNDAPSYHKYDARHWRHIDRNFGPSPKKDIEIMASETPDDPSTWQMTTADELFVDLIRRLHDRGIRVIMDYSWNHTGHTFWAFKDVQEKGEASPYKDWYWIDAFDDPATPENEFAYQGWMGVFDLAEIRETVRHEPPTPLMAYEGDLLSSSVKTHIFNVTKKWLDPDGDGDPSDGVDGFRLDVAAEIGLGFWRDYRRFVRDINPEAYFLGEIWWAEWPDDLLDPQPFLEGDVFDAVMNYRWYRDTRHFFNAAPDAMPASVYVDSLQHISSNLRPVSNYAIMNLAASHDSPRVVTSLYNKNTYKYMVSPSPTNDYKINKPDAATYETLRLLLAQQFTYVGAPHIWAGDEMGMWSADFVRKPLIWPELQFETETLHPFGLPRPTSEVKFDAGLFAYYQQLIDIRKTYPALISGSLDFILVDDERQLLAYSRQLDGQEVIAVFNAGAQPRTIQLPVNTTGVYTEVLNQMQIQKIGEQIEIELPARAAGIIVN